MSEKRRFGGSHVREAKPSAPPRFSGARDEVRRIRGAASARLGGLFNEAPMCACGSRDGLRFVTIVRREQDEEGCWREVTTASWRCHGCRQMYLPW